MNIFSFLIYSCDEKLNFQQLLHQSAETFLIIIRVENSCCAAYYCCRNRIHFVRASLIKRMYSVTYVTSVPWDTERVLRHKILGENSFFSDTEAFFFLYITQVLPNYWFVWLPQLNQSGAAQPMAGKPAKVCQNGWGIWLYNVGIRQGSSGHFRLKLCSRVARQSTQYSFRISGIWGYGSNRVHSLSILHFVLHRKTLGEPV